jgi:hypothetical protein
MLVNARANSHEREQEDTPSALGASSQAFFIRPRLSDKEPECRALDD